MSPSVTSVCWRLSWVVTAPVDGVEGVTHYQRHAVPLINVVEPLPSSVSMAHRVLGLPCFGLEPLLVLPDVFVLPTLEALLELCGVHSPDNCLLGHLGGGNK